MAQCRSNTKLKQSLRGKSLNCTDKEDCLCAACCSCNLEERNTQAGDFVNHPPGGNSDKSPNKLRPTSVINLRSSNRVKAEQQHLPDVGATGTSPTTHSNMKTKQTKEESDKSIDEDSVIEPKTRARKKASDLNDDDRSKPSQEEPKTSKETKKPVNKPKAVVKKRPLGIRKTLRGKKPVVTKDKIKTIVKQVGKRGRKPAIKPDPDSSQDPKTTVPLIPASEIKKEPIEETASNSRSSSPRTAGRRQRLSSDIIMMKSVLADSPTSLVIGPRTSPYSMRSERSNSPLLADAKNLRSGKPRKVKNNLLNEVVMKEQKKRRRLLSDSKNTDTPDVSEDCKKLKRGRSCSRDGSEISKSSDVTESDISLNESFNDADSKELNKKLEKSKTDLDVDIENNVQISTTEKVPSLNVDSSLAGIGQEAEPSCVTNKKNKEKLSLKRSTSLDSDNNNSNRKLSSTEIEEKLLKTDTIFEARSSILTSMSKTFNSKEVSKNIRKARKGRKAMAASRTNSTGSNASPVKACTTSTIANDPSDDKGETIETLSKEIDDLINDLDQHIDQEHDEMSASTLAENTPEQMQAKTVSKFYGLSKPLGDNNSIVTPDTPIKDKESVTPLSNETTPSKTDDSENIRLHYEDSAEKSTDGTKAEIFKCKPVVASIDKLMDRLKEFEEFDKKRQRQESESKSNESKPMMVTNDVVLITKSGADIKPLKDIQSVRSPERPIEKENVLSCFENNSAISIVKRDQVRKSTDVDLPNSVTLIKRNSISARKESTSSNHSKESDAISIFEKSLGKDVTLTEIRKSVDKSAAVSQVDLHQFGTLQPNPNQSLAGVVIDSNQISILPRMGNETKASNNDIKIINKRKSRESLSSKSAESTPDGNEEKMATLEKIKSPQHQMSSAAISVTPAPVAVKSQEMQHVEAEALPPPVVEPKTVPEDTSLTTDIPKTDSTEITNISAVATEEPVASPVLPSEPAKEEKVETDKVKDENVETDTTVVVPPVIIAEKMAVDEKPIETDIKPKATVQEVTEKKEEKPSIIPEMLKTPEIAKVVKARSKSARNSIESLPGPSNILHETPESRERKEAVLRTLGLLTHKAAKEAKIEKQKEKERIYNSNKNKSSKAASGDYTGTLKTVIKLNRGTGERDKKKYRSSLKMTFQKSKHRSGKSAPEGEAADEEGAYYTIEKREGGAGATSDGGHRKSHYSNRLNNHDLEAAPEPVEPKETLNLVIPEKASSFSIHPGRLCMDQCFYCGGKFGLFDTPCHIAQMKSSDRQKKVLDNEEKLTIDSCLCDACYRHVDRRANCPSYRKRPLGKPDAGLPSPPPATQPEKQPSPPLEEESDEDSSAPSLASGRPATCHTEGCSNVADNSIRRKWLIKMRNSVSKVLTLKCDYPGLHTIPLCGAHYRLLSVLMSCVLCRRVTKHNAHLIHHSYTELNPLLAEAGVPVQFSERPLLCKFCRAYCSLLQRAGHADRQAQGYRRKLLQIYNIEVPPGSDNDADEATMVQEENNVTFGKQKKKQRTKSKQRKSTEPEKAGDSESSERTTPHDEGSPEKREDSNDGQKPVTIEQKPLTEQKTEPIEEDIESLISSNKILVPGAVKPPEPTHSDESDVYDFEAPVLDKQTELQYLLQKQNNPAQFLQKPANLTQKQRNIMKIQTSGIHKPGHQHRINEKNAKKIHKLGHIIAHKEKMNKKEHELQIFDPDKGLTQEGIPILKNITLNDECTIESIPNKKPADIATLKNKWQMSESFTQVKKNLSELSKKLSTDKEPTPKKSSDTKYSNPVKRLETNPSISVRELFPGEEEMNLHCNIDFNNVKGVTPEGWEKCNSTIQYDVETKRLWNELQRPYGNQSSFMRHLILLEKYFRNGDLVLSHNATPHAANYSDSVQSRLRAYDNIVNDTPRRSEPAISLLEFRKKPSINGKSLLKTSQNPDEKDPKKFMPPPPFPKPKPPKADKSKSKALPPELIAINTPNAQGRKAIQNVLQNIQQLVKDVSASDPTEVAAAPLPMPKFDPPKFEPPKFEAPKVDTPKADPPKEKKDTPKADTPKRQKAKSKPWRPTLMPITPENLAKAASEPPQVAVDGRLLPSLVQVKTNQKRYHITLQDYNKMCLIRREKMRLLQDGDAGKPSEDTTVVTEIQPSALLGNGGTLVQNIIQEDKEMPELGQISSNAATILKNVGLKNITIAPIMPKTATVTSQTLASPVVTSPSLLVTSMPRLPQLGPAVSITSEAVTPGLPVMSSTHMIMPKIPKSLTVIPQTVMASAPHSAVVVTPAPATVTPTLATVTPAPAPEGPRP